MRSVIDLMKIKSKTSYYSSLKFTLKRADNSFYSFYINFSLSVIFAEIVFSLMKVLL